MINNFLTHRASYKERGLKLIEEKLKPAFKKIHDCFVNVSSKKERNSRQDILTSSQCYYLQYNTF